MSRRIETAYKAKSPSKSAQHNKAQNSGDMVNAAVSEILCTFLKSDLAYLYNSCYQ
jgi:hypothetical protein